MRLAMGRANPERSFSMMNAMMNDSPVVSGNKGRMFKVLCPVNRKDGTTHWMRVGTGFPNKDQSVNMYLDVLPVNQKLQLREMDEEDFAPRHPRRNEDAGAPRSQNEIPF
jgi:hypothetical protein